MMMRLGSALPRRVPGSGLLCVAVLAASTVFVPASASAQSIMDRIKAAAQAKQGAQPTAKPGQPTASTRPGQPAASGPAAGDSGPFTAPPGTVITPLVIGPSSIPSTSVSISPMGVHASVTAQSGSRLVVTARRRSGPEAGQDAGGWCAGRGDLLAGRKPLGVLRRHWRAVGGV